MQTTFALAALAAVAYAVPQVTGDIAPSAPAPEGCAVSYAGTFQITAVNSKVMKRDIYKRACGDPGSLVITLTNGQLHDAKGRTGYVASNYQFQFDAPPQAGAIYTGGFSACNNGSLALGGSAVFYECLSGDFYNLYDRQWSPQCEPILIDILPCSSSSGDPIGQGSDGQPTGTAIETVTEISDGQPQVPTGNPVTEISDGQPQAPTGQPAPITQISDGQPQAPAPTAGGSFPPSVAPSQIHTTSAVGSFVSSAPVAATTFALAAATTSAPAAVTTAAPPATGDAPFVRGSSFAAVVAAMIAAALL